MNTVSVYIKPTNHNQVCQKCFKELVKGEEIVSMVDGAYNNRFTYSYYHIRCFIYCFIKQFGRFMNDIEDIKEEVMIENL